MDQSQITDRLKARFGERILSTYAMCGQEAVTILPADLVEVLTFLRDEPELRFNMLMDVGGVDYLGYGGDGEDEDEVRSHRFEIAYQMFSYDLRHRYRVKVAVKDDSVEVPSLWEIWRGANWMEREVFDMFGIRFTGHPNLRRILNHDDFVGHPLRKDYPITKRQKLSRPIDHLLTDKQEWA